MNQTGRQIVSTSLTHLVNTDQPVGKEGMGARHTPVLSNVVIFGQRTLTFFDEELQRVSESLESISHGSVWGGQEREGKKG